MRNAHIDVVSERRPSRSPPAACSSGSGEATDGESARRARHHRRHAATAARRGSRSAVARLRDAHARSSTSSSSSARTARSITSSRRTSRRTGSASTTSSRRRSSTRTARPAPTSRSPCRRARSTRRPSTYELSPGSKTPYACSRPRSPAARRRRTSPRVAEAEAAENRRCPPTTSALLTTGGTGLTSGTPDTRLAQNPRRAAARAVPAHARHRRTTPTRRARCTASTRCGSSSTAASTHVDAREPVGLQLATSSRGSRRRSAPATTARRSPRGFNDESTGEGSTSMGFYNVLQGDVPYFKSLADTYAMSDNFHQSIQGGTGANHIALGTGDADWYSDGKGNAIVPPDARHREPEPAGRAPNNWYTQDGYSGGTLQRLLRRRRSPASSAVDALPRRRCTSTRTARRTTTTCSTTTTRATSATAPSTPSTSSPSRRPSTPHDRRRAPRARHLVALLRRRLERATSPTRRATDPGNEYCNICNPFQYATSIMANAAVRTTHIKDTTDLYTDIQNGWLPAFSIVKPSGLLDGHPASSKLDLFEGFSKKIVDAIQAQPDALEGHGDLHHVRRGRRLLRLGLRAAARLLRRRHAHPAHHRVAVRDGRARLARVRRPRLDPEVRRAELGPAADHEPQPRQPAEPDRATRQPVGAAQRPGDRRPLRPVRLRSPLRDRLFPRGAGSLAEAGAARFCVVPAARSARTGLSIGVAVAAMRPPVLERSPA